jgi:predicted ArsR family transcriptional regulator
LGKTAIQRKRSDNRLMTDVLPVRASQIAHALKLPRESVVRRLEELIEHGYVERVGNAYRVTDKVNIPDLQNKLQRRIDMVTETAKRLSELTARSIYRARVEQYPGRLIMLCDSARVLARSDRPETMPR